MFWMKTPICLLLLFLLFPLFTKSQETNYINTRKILKERGVKERITWDVMKDSSKISVDKYDGLGNKIQAIEIYEGKRTLQRFNWQKDEWLGINTTTTFDFEYDSAGNQTLQLDENYNPKDDNQMYKYDEFGNIVSWDYGRTFQSAYMRSYNYDLHGTISSETYYYWQHDPHYTGNKKDSALQSLVTKYYLKYDSLGNLIEKLANYMDRMAGNTWEYIYDSKGHILEKKENYVWSYFGIDHDIPTIKDVDRTRLQFSWKYVYDKNGELMEETKTEYREDNYNVTHIYKYNNLGLVNEELDDYGSTEFFYDKNGLLIEKKHFFGFAKNKLESDYKYEYKY
jgi:hypothetical protein